MVDTSRPSELGHHRLRQKGAALRIGHLLGFNSTDHSGQLQELPAQVLQGLECAKPNRLCIPSIPDHRDEELDLVFEMPLFLLIDAEHSIHVQECLGVRPDRRDFFVHNGEIISLLGEAVKGNVDKQKDFVHIYVDIFFLSLSFLSILGFFP